VSHEITAAWAVPGLTRPTGLAARGADLVLVGQGGQVWTLERPTP